MAGQGGRGGKGPLMSSPTEAHALHSVSLAGFKAAADSFQVNALQLAYRVRR
jgi:hypothetical protein